MQGMNYWAIVVAALAAFVASFVWYVVFGKQLATVSKAFAELQAQRRQPWKMLVVLAQNLVIAFVVAYVIGLTGIHEWIGAVGIGILLWFGMSAMQWVGSMLWENVPLKMAAIHAGDWLVHLVVISANSWRVALGAMYGANKVIQAIHCQAAEKWQQRRLDVRDLA